MSTYKNSYKCNTNYLLPNVPDQNNIVEGLNSEKEWANVTGYGNIVVSNKKSSKQNPWNRIPPLITPTSTPVVIKDAWDV